MARETAARAMLLGQKIGRLWIRVPNRGQIRGAGLGDLVSERERVISSRGASKQPLKVALRITRMAHQRPQHDAPSGRGTLAILRVKCERGGGERRATFFFYLVFAWGYLF